MQGKKPEMKKNQNHVPLEITGKLSKRGVINGRALFHRSVHLSTCPSFHPAGLLGFTGKNVSILEYLSGARFSKLSAQRIVFVLSGMSICI